MTISDMEHLLGQTIPKIQDQLRALDKTERVTVEDMKDLLRLEKMGKNRRGITGWLEVGIIQERLPDEFFLDYQSRTGLYKSAVQKYIRRGNVEKAVQAAKVLYGLSKDQAIRRLKIIVVEDAFSAVESLRFFSEKMSLSDFLAVVAVIAQAPKDKSLCSLGWQVTEGMLAPQVETVVPDVSWLKEHLLDKQEYIAVVIQLFKLAKDKRFAEINEIFKNDQDQVVRQCLDRVAGGTFWPSDSALLIMAAIRYLRGDHRLKNLTLPPIDDKSIQPLKLSEIDWYCVDFHTHVGRIAERFFLARHKGITQKMLEAVWFFGESARLGGEILARWDQPYNEALWERIKHEVQRTVEDVMFKKFKFRELDEIERTHAPAKSRDLL